MAEASDATLTEPAPAGGHDDLVGGMRDLLDGSHAEVRRKVVDGLVPFASVLEDADTMTSADFRERVRDLLVELAGSGLTGLGFPEEYGGGGHIGASIAAFESLAHGDLSVLVKAGVQFGLFGGAILQLGTKRHHDAYLADVVAARTLGCFAMTEHGHGSNVAALGTVATYDADTQEFVITTAREDAYKDYIGNAARHAELAVVFAQLETAGENHGVHAFVVRIREGGEPVAGVRIGDDGPKMGLNGVDNGRLWFDGLRVPREALLNRFADVSPDGVYGSPIESKSRRFFTMLGTLVQGRVSVGGAAITASKVALTIAITYAGRRRQFEASDPETEDLLLDYGLHQRRLLPLLARTYALHFAQEVLRDDLHAVFSGALSDDLDDDEIARRTLESRAAGTKALATWHATHTIQECREACGGAGYLAANRFAALKADTDVFTTFEGDNHVLLQLVAKGLLTDYAGAFEDMNQLDMVRFVGGLAVDTVLERTAVHKLLERVRDLLPGGSSGPDGSEPVGDRVASASERIEIRDADYHLAMLSFREEHILGSAARRLKAGVDKGGNPGEVFSSVQDHVIAAARAHVERLVLEAFAAKVEATPDGPVRDALTLLRDLHALWVIETDRAWFMEHGRLSSARSKAITTQVNALCREVRRIAQPLVDAFAIPRELLRADDLLG
ncbi:acyl-CoA dehydrogenase [Nocardioides sp. CER19]|uniref:acyl-CoA dehydrogenase family protein n=1 Tax=Nocardioides sp. CER19 TaxID=3038538 RepID=UPI0024498F28|nr:acyl-CoA dehydrogenase [Nocardioides sp. CER19]MDH2414202.1 acyl-CoA dehydrogenase [Nocardioides sp. CER19]